MTLMKSFFREPKSTRVLSADLPPSYNVVMDNLDLFQAVSTHEKSETPPPSFQSQIDPAAPMGNVSNHRNQTVYQTVLTIS